MNCSRLGLMCSNDLGNTSLPAGPTTPTNTTTQAGTRRRRNCAPCNECRNAKAKCSDIQPPCSRCQRLNLRCVYPVLGETSEPSQSPATTQTASFVSPRSGYESFAPERYFPVLWGGGLISCVLPRLLEGVNVSVLLGCYFQKIHPLRCFGFIHEPSFMQQLDRGSLSSALLLAVCALASTSPHHSGPTGNTEEWAKESLQIIFRNLGNISVSNLMVFSPPRCNG
jgi:hypothetical protein